MTRAACTFRQRDLTRAIRATKAAGVDIRRIEIGKDGKIAIVTVETESTEDDLDLELQAWEAPHGEG